MAMVRELAASEHAPRDERANEGYERLARAILPAWVALVSRTSIYQYLVHGPRREGHERALLLAPHRPFGRTSGGCGPGQFDADVRARAWFARRRSQEGALHLDQAKAPPSRERPGHSRP